MNLARVSTTQPVSPKKHDVNQDDIIPFVVDTDDGVAFAEPAPTLAPVVVERRSGLEAFQAVTASARRAFGGVRAFIGQRPAPPETRTESGRLAPVLERALASWPEDGALTGALGRLRQGQYDTERSVAIVSELLPIFSRLGDPDAFAYCCRKLDRLTSTDPVARYRDLAALYSKAGRFDAAAAACRISVECLLDDGHAGAAVRFVNHLPSLGPSEAKVRADLLRLVARAVEVNRSAASTELAKIENTEDPRPEPVSFLNPAIFLVGRLGSVSLFDIVQIVENNGLTGRFELQSESGCGAFHFDGGRIVAAIFEGETGFDAAKSLVRIERGTFQVVRSELVGRDDLDVTSNTGFLMNVLCKIDEEQLAADTSGGLQEKIVAFPVH